MSLGQRYPRTKIAFWNLAGVVITALIVGLFLFPTTQRVYALAIRTVEFTFVILDEETGLPIPGASIDIWDDPESEERKKLVTIVSDEKGIAKYVREKMRVEDVEGISAGHKLQGIRRHPDGVGTFVDRYWCALDVTAKGYMQLKFAGLYNYDYEDNGYVKSGKFHRFEFKITLRRK